MKAHIYICEDTNEVFYNYKSYLKSKHWKLKKDEYFSVYKKECAICKKNKKLNLHHKTYDNVGNELLEDLVLLCEECHNKIHNCSQSDNVIENKKKKNINSDVKNNKISNFCFDEENILYLPCKVSRQCRRSNRKGVINITGNELFLYMLFIKTKEELSINDILKLITNPLINKPALSLRTIRTTINGLLEKDYIMIIKHGRINKYKIKSIETDRIKLLKINSKLIDKIIAKEITTEELKCYIKMRYIHNEEVLKGIGSGNIFRVSMNFLASSLNITQQRISQIIENLYRNSIIERNKISMEYCCKFMFSYEYKLKY
ncbi:HNH endonuclease [Clostridium perfringens]|uniref:HNH endonuclease signature motif containing protein n=1 Tax=Clostridium perfringens TaxID=1502 RepID=UPI00224643F9|nr:HNH endonuclease signature motif containing protein [Clostridium perfringens]MCX0396192.1 HNH endonuclease [Clostridium perfringens]